MFLVWVGPFCLFVSKGAKSQRPETAILDAGTNFILIKHSRPNDIVYSELWSEKVLHCTSSWTIGTQPQQRPQKIKRWKAKVKVE